MPVSAASPAFVQDGERGTQIYNEGQLQINNNVFLAANGAGQDDRADAILFYLNNRSCEYYNLFVGGFETSDCERFFVDVNRALTEYTSPEIKAMFGALSAESIERIKTFPSLVMNENRFISRRNIDPEQNAFYGFVSDIVPQSTGIRILFQKLLQLPQQDINRFWRELDIQCPDGHGELERSHWAIKRVNLLDELRRAELVPAQY
jgi:hypothetical protein